MPRRFITKVDIDRLIGEGATELVASPECVVTDLAREYARDRGLPVRTAPAAPRTPSPVTTATGAPAPASPPAAAPAPGTSGAGVDRGAVRAAVIARLGSEPPGLDDALRRVLGD